jgi:hypothetical protein
VECFDLNKQSWTLVTPHMLSRRHGHQATFLNQEPILYAIGGHDGPHFLNSVERYRPLEKQKIFILLNLQGYTGIRMKLIHPKVGIL